MTGIEDLAEGQAFMDAADDILGLNHPLRDTEIERLRSAWIAGRDYARAAHTAPSDAVRAAAERWESERFTTRSGHPTERTVIAVMREGFEDGYRAAFAGRAGGGEETG